MSSVFRRNEVWYVRYKDGRGKWRSLASTATSKTDAKRLAGELEHKSERQRLGLEPLPDEDGGGALGELVSWWLETYSKGTASHSRNVSVLERHVLSSPLAELRLSEVTSGRIEAFLQERSEHLSPRSVNHLRRFLSTIFNKARASDRWSGSNPVTAVKKRKVPDRLPDFLRVDEVPRVLEALSDGHRPIFATAIYTGMRKGELIGLKKSDIDFASNLIMVQRSYDRDTTKGGKGAAIPIASELVPHLKNAIEVSPSEYVFPGPDGGMMSSQNPLEKVLRRALGRAGITLGYIHVCRKKGCDYSERADDNSLRRCPTHGHRLWPKAQVRPIRFHDLRHSTASLLLMAGASLASVQKIMRHADPRITAEVYGHLLPDYLRSEVDRLRFGALPSAPATASAEDALARSDSIASQTDAAASSRLVTTLLQHPLAVPENDESADQKPADSRGVISARPARFELATFGSVDRRSIQLSHGRLGEQRVARLRRTPNENELRPEDCSFGGGESRLGSLGHRHLEFVVLLEALRKHYIPG